jgi:peptide/nickel transport system permease protein
METTMRVPDVVLDRTLHAGERLRTRLPLLPAVGVVLLVFIIALATIGPYLYPEDARTMKGRRFQPPGRSFLLGTDYLGRDVLAGIVAGARTSLTAGAAATAIVLTIGLLVGAIAGYYGGRVDNALMRVTEFFQVLPAFLFAMVLVAIFSPTL